MAKTQASATCGTETETERHDLQFGTSRDSGHHVDFLAALRANVMIYSSVRHGIPDIKLFSGPLCERMA